jgi:hypothetical protein
LTSSLGSFIFLTFCFTAFYRGCSEVTSLGFSSVNGTSFCFISDELGFEDAFDDFLAGFSLITGVIVAVS